MDNKNEKEKRALELETQIKKLQNELRRLKMPEDFSKTWEDDLDVPLLSQAHELQACFLAEASSRETPNPKVCPKCKKLTKVKATRSRKIQTMHGSHSFSRNYHYCSSCKYGFYPLDTKLGLSVSGDLSSKMERLVFGPWSQYNVSRSRRTI